MRRNFSQIRKALSKNVYGVTSNTSNNNRNNNHCPLSRHSLTVFAPQSLHNIIPSLPVVHKPACTPLSRLSGAHTLTRIRSRCGDVVCHEVSQPLSTALSRILPILYMYVPIVPLLFTTRFQRARLHPFTTCLTRSSPAVEEQLLESIFLFDVPFLTHSSTKPDVAAVGNNDDSAHNNIAPC